MDISINGQAADITLESERTIGEVLTGLEGWLNESEFCLNGLEINGETVGSDAVAAAFEQDLEGVEALDIKVCSRSDLALDALCQGRDFLAAFSEAECGDTGRITGLWENSAAASFLKAENPALFQDIDSALRGEGVGGCSRAAQMLPLIDDRIREIAGPVEEFDRMEGLVSGITGRLEELPLDIQTGKDGRAAETVSLFTGVTEKLFRIFFLLQARDKTFGGILIESIPVYDFLGEFSAALKELLAAYESKDVVLVGDLAEYELAPRLRTFYAALKTPARPC
ncbi:hypothetical protein AGMMS49991_01020 [Spirochaetia bacterium]|nr:hypothetical protein AGMMS49991_01020 [Spirochaetia bacterium]